MEHISSQQHLLDPDLLVEQHRSYVRAIAVGILAKMPPHIELEELISCGNLGLVKAASRYDPRRGVSFTTFSYYYIRGAIYDEIRKMGFFSRRDYEKIKLVANLNDVMQTVVDEQQSETEHRAIALEDEIAQLQAEVGALIPTYLLSLSSCSEAVLNQPDTNAVEALEKQELVHYTMQLLKELPDEDKDIIEEIYFKNRTAASVAEERGLSRSWLSRLHSRAIDRLRELMVKQGILNPNA